MPWLTTLLATLPQAVVAPPPAEPAPALEAYDAPACSLAPAERDRLLALPMPEFDQTAAGWRSVAARGCYMEAAELIEAYASTSANPRWQPLLQFHHFQMLAHAGDTGRALQSLSTVRQLDEMREADLGWRLYVAGTDAFLRNDRDELDASLTALVRFAGEGGPLAQATSTNANVLRALVRCFGRPYKVAYTGRCTPA